LAKAIVDLQALQANYRFLKNLAPNAQAMAVIKADAYGHGLLACAQALSNADGLAVARIEEALSLRQSGIKNKILLLEGVFSEQEFKAAFEHDITIVIHDVVQLRHFKSFKPIDNQKINCWIKVNTGMNRLGFSLQELQAIAQEIAQSEFINCEALMTHLANADVCDEHGHSGNQLKIAEPLQKFEQAKKIFPKIKQYSVANSAAILAFPEAHSDWNRPGISLYGSTVFENFSSKLKPVMQLSAPVLAIHKVKQGESVGYGSTWTTEKDTLIAVLGIGYGDGYPRHAKNGTPVLINNQEYCLAGRVSMDMITVNLVDNKHNVKVGDKAILWGASDDKTQRLSADLVADFAETISYELFCGVTGRVIKDYVGV
jgi:alanine racemase